MAPATRADDTAVMTKRKSHSSPQRKPHTPSRACGTKLGKETNPGRRCRLLEREKRLCIGISCRMSTTAQQDIPPDSRPQLLTKNTCALLDERAILSRDTVPRVQPIGHMPLLLPNKTSKRGLAARLLDGSKQSIVRIQSSLLSHNKLLCILLQRILQPIKQRNL